MKRLIFVLTIMLVVICSNSIVYGDEDLSQYDFGDIDKLLEDEETESSFSDLVKELLSGDSEGVFGRMFDLGVDKLFGEIAINKGVVVKIVLLAISAALLSKLSVIFAGSKVSDMGFFSVFSLLMVLLVGAFAINSNIAVDVVHVLISFMKVLIPVFFLAVGVASGVTASLGMYEIAFISIMAVEYIILKFIIPAVSVYVIILILNNMLEEDYLSKFAAVIETVIDWSIKIIPTLAIGINLVASIALPSVDYAKSKGYRKLFGLIPGVGGSVDSFVDIVTGSSTLIKNCIGSAALVVVILLVLIPVIKLLTACLMYKVAAAVVQPISDKRVTSSVEVMAKGTNMLYRIVLSCGLMFFLTIGIVCLGTGR
mgnify:CR=1 FL=1